MPASSLYEQELVSDEIREVIRYRPHWIIRNGNTIFIGVILFFAGIAWLVKYSDTINTKGPIIQTTSGFYGELKSGKADRRKIKKGERINIRLGSYPQEKLTGFITDVRIQEDSCLITADFPNALQTGSVKNILRGNIFVQGEIITSDQRLLTRVFDQLRQAWKR